MTTGDDERPTDAPKEAKRAVVFRMPHGAGSCAFAATGENEEVWIKPELVHRGRLRLGQVVYLVMKDHERGLRAKKVFWTKHFVSKEDVKDLERAVKAGGRIGRSANE
jgi:hypothetical protein